MLKRNVSGLLLTALVLMTGCATTGVRSNQTEIDAMNAKAAALQGQLTEKDRELSSLQSYLAEQRAAREAAEAEKQRLASQLEDAKAASYKAKAPASDLK